MTTLDATLTQAYLDSHYYFYIDHHSQRLKIGQRSIISQQLLIPYPNQGAVLITAWNPFSQLLDPYANDRANQQLRQSLVALKASILPAYGASADGQWREDGFFAYPISRKTACELCYRYQQNAAIFIDSGGMPELLLHPQRILGNDT